MSSERGEPVIPERVFNSRDEGAGIAPPQQDQNPKKKCKCKKVKPTKGCMVRILIGCLLAGFIVYLIVDFSRVKDGFVSFINWVALS